MTDDRPSRSDGGRSIDAEAVDTETAEAADTETAEAADTETAEAADAGTADAADTETADAADTETTDAADTETADAEAVAADSVDSDGGTDDPTPRDALDGAERGPNDTSWPADTDPSSASTETTPGASESGGATGPVRTSVRSETLRSTNHWVGFATLAFLAGGLGVALQSRSLLLAAVVGVGYLAYANVTEAPEPSLAVERRCSTERPEPGDTVEVTLVVENVGETVLPDLRLVEQVPEALAVTDGPARTATALRPGARMTFSYSVLARRGAYEFDGLTAIARNASGSRERECDLSTEPISLTCLAPIDATEAVPLRGLTSPYTGRVSTNTSGEGTEFASLREYQHGDALSRIDWNSYARDGTLATMEFREERMATVVVVLDLRGSAYLQAGEDGLHAVDRGIDATRRIFNSLLDTGDRVGLAAFASESVWLAPGAGATHQARARELLSTHPALSPTPPDERVYVRWQLRRLHQRLDDDAQVVFVSPMPDDTSSLVARSLQVRGHPVTVVSPDATLRDTPGHTLAAIERSNRLNDLRGSGVRVVDWAGEERLAEALERARRRWSA